MFTSLANLAFRAVVGLAVASLALLAQTPHPAKRAPSFTLPDSQTHYYDLLEYRGKPLIIEIMSTICPHCQNLAITLEKVSKHYGDKIAILSVVVPPDDQSKVRQFVLRYGVTHPVLFDCGQMTASYFNATPDNPHIDVPHLFFIDKDGFIRDDFTWAEPPQGQTDDSEINTSIEPLLK